MVLFGAAISSEAFVIILVFFRVSENDEFFRGLFRILILLKMSLRHIGDFY